jgi:hypothetical protein
VKIRQSSVLLLLLAFMSVATFRCGVAYAGNNPTTSTNTKSASAVPSRDPAGIFDGNGNFDAQAYIKMAKEYGTSAMIPERFGNDWSHYHSTFTAPTWWQPPLRFYDDGTNRFQKFHYSLGSACGRDDYSTSYGEVAYVTDATVSESVPGVDGIATLQRDHCIWSGLPQRFWTGVGPHPSHELKPKVVQMYDRYGMPRQPVEAARAYGASEAAGCSYLVFQDGQVACGEGGNTASDKFYMKPFPANFTPTAASVTNNGEFLLVTGWNTDTYRGELAVVAMGSAKPAGTFWGYEWDEVYPGFRNYSLPVFSKLLGIIELTGMVAPTAIEAVGNWVYEPGAFLPVNSRESRDWGQPGHFPLSDKTNWQCFVDGVCASLYDTAGFAIVASRYERKVLVVDLGPLFRAFQAGMFTSFTQFRNNVANTGTKAGQWPPTFSEDPDEQPTIVKSITFPSEVTAISASLYPDNRGMVATEDGHIHVLDMDGLQTRTGTGNDAREIFDVYNMGRNITRIAHLKHWDHGGDNGGLVRWQYLVLSRGDKAIRWIDLSGGVPAVVRTLQDSRLVDPISVEDNNNHGTQTDLIDVADFGDSNVKAYRYGRVIFWTTPGTPEFGMGKDGKDSFEYEGAYATPTGPFAISIENVP